MTKFQYNLYPSFYRQATACLHIQEPVLSLSPIHRAPPQTRQQTSDNLSLASGSQTTASLSLSSARHRKQTNLNSLNLQLNIQPSVTDMQQNIK